MDRRQQRKAAGLTLPRFAEKVELHKATLSRWERGLRELSAETESRVVAALEAEQARVAREQLAISVGIEVLSNEENAWLAL